MKFHRLCASALLAALASALIGAAPSVPTLNATLPSSIVFTPVITGLTQPVFVTGAGVGSNRLFVVQQPGQIRIFQNGSLLSTPLLDISGVSGFTHAASEQGLLGLAFDPHYATNRYFYVTYTITTGNSTFPYAVRLVRYQTSATDANAADPASAFIILTTPKKWTNHNGGMIAFGPDGYLYWGTGDGGSAGDPDNNAQNIHRLLGKMLRLDVDSTPPAGQTYVIPPTNPFFGNSDSTVRQEIWSYGLRNPWRWSFDRSTGDLYIGDVGQNRQEEIDFQPASASAVRNYGWHVLEGTLCYSPSTGCVKPAHYIAPVSTYNHGTNESIGCAVTGGYVYRGSASPLLQGIYFFGDYCSGRVWGLVDNSGTWSRKLVAATPYNISSFGQDEAGELYVVDHGAGRVLRISQPSIVTAPAFISEGALDGTVTETKETSSIGGPTDPTGQTFSVGDTAKRQQQRAILSFDTSSLPDNAVITSAMLRIDLSSMSTPDPFSALGALKVDIGGPRFGTLPALQSMDFQATATAYHVAAFDPTPAAGWYSAAIGSSYFRYINRKGRTQFRLRFSLGDNNDSVANYAAFFSGDATTASTRPQLVIQYYVP